MLIVLGLHIIQAFLPLVAGLNIDLKSSCTDYHAQILCIAAAVPVLLDHSLGEINQSPLPQVMQLLLELRLVLLIDVLDRGWLSWIAFVNNRTQGIDDVSALTVDQFGEGFIPLACDVFKINLLYDLLVA